MPRRKEPRIPDAVLDQLLAGADPKTAFDPNGLLDDLKKALAERVLNAEMDHHLAGEEPGNRRNGYGKKTVITDTGQIELAVPRDRQASFDPQLIAKYQRRFPGFDDKIISMYARGMSTREIVGHLRDLYGIEVSPDLISAVTDAVLEEVAAWQARPLEAIYPLIFFDALRVKIRDEGLVRNKAVHIALGVRADGTKEILGLWLEQNEGAKFWLRVMNELKNRGVEDVLIAVVDGLKGFPEAITAVFPQATVQTCIVHLLRHSLDFVSWKDRKPVAAALKDIYRAVDAAAGEAALSAFEESFWGQKYPAIGQSWRRAWGEVVPFYAFPGDVRRILYTTNAIEALNSKLRRAVRARGHFPSDEAATKAPLPGLEPLREGVDHAAARVVPWPSPSSPSSSASASQQPWPDRFNRPAAHEIPDSPWSSRSNGRARSRIGQPIARSPRPQLGELAGHRVAARLPVARDPHVQRCHDPTHAQRSSAWVERRRPRRYVGGGCRQPRRGGVGSAPGARTPRPGTAPPSVPPHVRAPRPVQARRLPGSPVRPPGIPRRTEPLANADLSRRFATIQGAIWPPCANV